MNTNENKPENPLAFPCTVKRYEMVNLNEQGEPEVKEYKRVDVHYEGVSTPMLIERSKQ